MRVDGHATRPLDGPKACRLFFLWRTAPDARQVDRAQASLDHILRAALLLIAKGLIWIECDEAAPERRDRQLCSRTAAELPSSGSDMCLRRSLGDLQLNCDLGVRQPVDDERDDLKLSGRQGFVAG